MAAARSAVLGTVDAAGRPHLVPITFAVDGDILYTVVDDKPKSGRRLKRLRNIEARPEVSVLVDDYSEDWSRLWWCRLDGQASVLQGAAVPDVLVERYPAYGQTRPSGPLIEVRIASWTGWAASI